MPWNESTKMDEKLKFVSRFLDGEKISRLCEEFGISRVTSHKIIDRYKESGLEAFNEIVHESRKGDCCDNAPKWRLLGRPEVGRLYGRRFATRRATMDEVIDWLTFYNLRRLHSTLGHFSPMVFEQRWIAAQQQDGRST